MKAISLVASGLAVLASGCASAPSSGYADNTDMQKVRAIERVARVNGIEVHWINYPQLKARAVETTAPVAPAALPTGT